MVAAEITRRVTSRSLAAAALVVLASICPTGGRALAQEHARPSSPEQRMSRYEAQMRSASAKLRQPESAPDRHEASELPSYVAAARADKGPRRAAPGDSVSILLDISLAEAAIASAGTLGLVLCIEAHSGCDPDSERVPREGYRLVTTSVSVLGAAGHGRFAATAWATVPMGTHASPPPGRYWLEARLLSDANGETAPAGMNGALLVTVLSRSQADELSVPQVDEAATLRALQR
jgi:hypothetical protein